VVTGLNILGSNKALQDHEIKRVIAYIIDAIIVWVIALIITIVAIPFWYFGGYGIFFFGLGALIYAVFAILYWAVQDAFMGGSIGKKIMALQVVGTTGPLDIVKAFIRNVTKAFWWLLLFDWIVGLAMEGDPRQKMTDRFAGTTVVRTDQQAYMEEQFRQMATPPPHPQAPMGYAQPAYAAPGYGAPPQQYQQPPPQQQAWQAAPPAGAPPQQAPAQQPQTWPGQQAPPAGGGWPQHQWNEQGQLQQQPRYCQNCGGPLVPRGDGHLVCSRCGTVI